MSSVMLPLFISYDELKDPSDSTIHELYNAWDLQMCDLGQRTDAYKAIVDFLARIDPYEESPVPKIPHDIELFQAHAAQAFRHSRMVLFIAVPLILASLGHSLEQGSAMDLLHTKLRDTTHTLEDAVAQANTHKENANKLVEAQKYGAAVEAYLLGLAVLVPFSSDNTIMTFEESGAAGLRQMWAALERERLGEAADVSEENLLTNLMTTANKAAAGRKKTARAWMWIFIGAVTCLEHHPHATYGGVVKRMKLHKEALEKHRACFNHAQISRFESRKTALEAWKKKDPAAPAHEHCDWTHACLRQTA